MAVRRGVTLFWSSDVCRQSEAKFTCLCWPTCHVQLRADTQATGSQPISAPCNDAVLMIPASRPHLCQPTLRCPANLSTLPGPPHSPSHLAQCLSQCDKGSQLLEHLSRHHGGVHGCGSQLALQRVNHCLSHLSGHTLLGLSGAGTQVGGAHDIGPVQATPYTTSNSSSSIMLDPVQ